MAYSQDSLRVATAGSSGGTSSEQRGKCRVHYDRYPVRGSHRGPAHRRSHRIGPAVRDAGPVEAAKLAIYASRGRIRVDKNGNTVPDDAKVKTSVYELFRDSIVINSEADIVDEALSQYDLFANTFPSVSTDGLDDDQLEAYRQVRRKMWQWASPAVNGYCQETSEMENLDYVMVEKRIYRASRDLSTGTVAPTAVSVRFFTQEPDLIFELSSQPAAAKFVKAAEEASKHLQMNTRRHPELTARVSREAQSAMKRSAAHLTPVTTARAGDTRALAAGGDDDS